MQKIKEIILHCSDSEFGNANLIRKWHKERGWRDIGYHFVSLNGLLAPDFYLSALDGSIECGRDLDGDNFIESNEVGAHALGYNRSSVGICLIGVEGFTENQLISTIELCADLMNRFTIDISDVLGHGETENAHGKTCPNIDMALFRHNLDYYMENNMRRGG